MIRQAVESLEETFSKGMGKNRSEMSRREGFANGLEKRQRAEL